MNRSIYFSPEAQQHILVEHLHEAPTLKPVPLNTFNLEALGFKRMGSMYEGEILRIRYDGCDWWLDDRERCNTKQELEKLML